MAHTGDIRALLMHSPLVGPATIQPLATALAQRGWSTEVPDLRGAVSTAHAFADHAASAAASGADVVLGHSGAGAFLPLVAHQLDAATMVFVDAIVPPAGPVYEPSPQLLTLLDRLPVVDGLLPPWQEWWAPDALVRLVPDVALRARITAEIPPTPRAFFDEPVPLPPSYRQRPAVYLQLSPAYDDDRARAIGWGWPTARVDGLHLDLCTQPERTAALVTDLLDHLESTRGTGSRTTVSDHGYGFDACSAEPPEGG